MSVAASHASLFVRDGKAEEKSKRDEEKKWAGLLEFPTYRVVGLITDCSEGAIRVWRKRRLRVDRSDTEARRRAGRAYSFRRSSSMRPITRNPAPRPRSTIPVALNIWLGTAMTRATGPAGRMAK